MATLNVTLSQSIEYQDAPIGATFEFQSLEADQTTVIEDVASADAVVSIAEAFPGKAPGFTGYIRVRSVDGGPGNWSLNDQVNIVAPPPPTNPIVID